MKPQRSLILCVSVHRGNTAKVAAAIGEELGAVHATPEEVPYASLRGLDLVGFGSGISYGRMSAALLDWVRGLPDAAEPATPAFLFSTSGLPWLSGLWHRPMRRLLARKGFRVVGEFSCGGHDTWGPLRLVGGLNRTHPDARDLDRARQFARTLAQRPASVRTGALSPIA